MSDRTGHTAIDTTASNGSGARDLRRILPVGRFQRAPHVEQAEHAGTVILFDKRTYFTLPEGVATEIWALLAEARSPEELVSRLHDAYDAPREVIAADVAAQLERLRRARLVRVLGPDGNPVRERRARWHFWRRDR